MNHNLLCGELRAVAEAMLVVRAKLTRLTYLEAVGGDGLAGRHDFRLIQVELLPVASALVELANFLESRNRGGEA
jgi:hypothetical protein